MAELGNPGNQTTAVGSIEIPESGQASKPNLTGYELFMMVLSVYSIFNLFLLILPFSEQEKLIILIMDAAISVFFLIEFARRLHRASNRRLYFLREHGWLDLIAGIPVPGFRFAMILRIREAVEQMRVRGLRTVIQRTGSGRASAAMLIAMMSTILVVQFGSMLVLRPEQKAAGANITTGGDAVWWSYVTITTVGYGDKYPVTTLGRIVGFMMLSVGVALFAVITSFLANAFINPRKQQEAADRQKQADWRELTELRAAIESLRSDVSTLTDEVRQRNSANDEIS